MTAESETCVREKVKIDFRGNGWRLKAPVEVYIEHIKENRPPNGYMVFGLRIDFYVVVLCDPEIKDIEGSGHTRGAAIHDLFMNLVNSLQCLEAHERRYYREYPSKDQRERAYLEDENLLLDFDTFGELEAQIDAINSLFEKEVTDD